jgi:hypothetical protein
MKAIVLAFLLQLEAIGATDPSLFSLDVLQRVHEPIQQALVEGRGDVVVPASFGLAGAETNRRVHDAVEGFIREARTTREFATAGTVDARIDMLFSDAIVTPTGAAYDDYFAFAATP